jgi:hypothetical protein
MSSIRNDDGDCDMDKSHFVYELITQGDIFKNLLLGLLLDVSNMNLWKILIDSFYYLFNGCLTEEQVLKCQEEFTKANGYNILHYFFILTFSKSSSLNKLCSICMILAHKNIPIPRSYFVIVRQLIFHLYNLSGHYENNRNNLENDSIWKSFFEEDLKEDEGDMENSISFVLRCVMFTSLHDENKTILLDLNVLHIFFELMKNLSGVPGITNVGKCFSNLCSVSCIEWKNYIIKESFETFIFPILDSFASSLSFYLTSPKKPVLLMFLKFVLLGMISLIEKNETGTFFLVTVYNNKILKCLSNIMTSAIDLLSEVDTAFSMSLSILESIFEFFSDCSLYPPPVIDVILSSETLFQTMVTALKLLTTKITPDNAALVYGTHKGYSLSNVSSSKSSDYSSILDFILVHSSTFLFNVSCRGFFLCKKKGEENIYKELFKKYNCVDILLILFHKLYLFPLSSFTIFRSDLIKQASLTICNLFKSLRPYPPSKFGAVVFFVKIMVEYSSKQCLCTYSPSSLAAILPSITVADSCSSFIFYFYCYDIYSLLFLNLFISALNKSPVSIFDLGLCDKKEVYLFYFTIFC